MSAVLKREVSTKTYGWCVYCGVEYTPNDRVKLKVFNFGVSRQLSVCALCVAKLNEVSKAADAAATPPPLPATAAGQNPFPPAERKMEGNDDGTKT